jgi:membrane-bound ClpP family serine protease
VALKDFDENNKGTVRVINEEWTAKSEDNIKKGDKIIVIDRESNVLYVKKQI